MKANVPEKTYFHGDYLDFEFNPFYSINIEYIRKDVFIEKACEFLKSYRQDTRDGLGYIPGIVNDETIEDFRNYMKGE